MLTAAAMLLAFFHVVQSSVLHGERLRLAMAAHSAAIRHCNSLPGTGATGNCLRQLSAPATADLGQSVVFVSTVAPLN